MLDIGCLHSILIHYPIAFYSYALLMDCASVLFKVKTSPFSEITICLAFLCSIPAIFTGWATVVFLPETPIAQQVAHDHEGSAYVLVVFGFFYAFLRVGELFNEWRVSKWVYAIMILGIFGTLFFTGDSGGKIARDFPGSPCHPKLMEKK